MGTFRLMSVRICFVASMQPFSTGIQSATVNLLGPGSLTGITP